MSNIAITAPPAIDVRGLKKNFNGFAAVKGISFQIAPGEVFSLLGPNGAGKSTTISVISGLLAPAAGETLIMGRSVQREPEGAKASLGVVPQDIALYPDLSARENLSFWGKMYGLRGAVLKARVDEVLETIGLTDRQHGRVGKFSGGMKRRVNIGAALLHRPGVVIMDEPTVGIDPQSRRHILDNVKALNQAGMAVLYTTHYMEEAAELSHHIAIMDQGRLIACGTHADLIRLIGELDRIELTLSTEAPAVLETWRRTEGVRQVASEDGKVALLVDDSNFVLPRLFEGATRGNTRITSVAIEEPNLEAVFLHLTGRALRD
ncbi:MAG: ABC transporter ATP-binding protein [Anaerolineales bacterium]|nr:ABC transporter ATP-binding protein [Anaerolineales bacterium]